MSTPNAHHERVDGAGPARRVRRRGVVAGLSAFPLTPLRQDRLDEDSFTGVIRRLAGSGVDSITALGSTGSFAYLDRDERARVARLAVEHAAGTPVLVGVGALRTSQVLAHVTDAEAAGADGVLLAPMSYHPLGDDEVFSVFRAVSDHTDLPVVIYDNPGTTHFTFSRELYGRIAALPGVASIKIPGVPTNPTGARERVAAIRAVIPEHVTIGVSGDSLAATGLNAGCDGWYSVLAGTLPEPAVQITRAALDGEAGRALELSERLGPLWELFHEAGGGLRVVAAIAEHLGLTPPQCLPLPVQGLSDTQRERVADVLARLGRDS